MELLQLRYFCTVARLGNITKAAKYHMIPQPAMSKTISKLESELGVSLFLRKNNKLVITPEGQLFYEKISNAIMSIDSAQSGIKDLTEIPKGIIKLSVAQNRSLTIDCISMFRKIYPNVDFYLDCNNSAKAEEDYDFYITGSMPSDKRFDSKAHLLSERLMLVTSKKHPLASLDSVSLSDLTSQEFAVVSSESLMWKKVLVKADDLGVKLNVGMECIDIHCILQYLDLCNAVVVGPEISWSNLKKDLAFIQLMPEINRSTFLYWDSNRNYSLAAKLFKESLLNYFISYQNGN